MLVDLFNLLVLILNLFELKF